jgi:hypothetical protein
MAFPPPPRNVYVVGAQCTGKTTLVNALEQYYTESNISHQHSSNSADSPKIIREVARKVLAKYSFTRNDITTSPSRALELQKRILEAQHEAEQLLLADPSSSWYISDCSGIDPIGVCTSVCRRRSSGSIAGFILLDSPSGKYEAGHCHFCEAGCSWLVDDGTRLMPEGDEDWMRVGRAFRHLLDRSGIEYHVIPKDMTDLAERVQLVKKRIGR